MKRAPRVLILILGLAAVARPSTAQTTPGTAEMTERVTRTVHLDQNGTFDLTNISGNIVISGGAGRDVTIDALKRVPRRPLLQMMDVQIVEQANRVEVRTVVPRPRNFPGSIDYTVMVPADASVTIRTVSGDVRATNIRGELLKSVSGAIEINNGSANDLLTASTVSGNVTVRGLKGSTIQLATVTGNVHAEDVQAERLQVRAVNGSIEYTGDLVRSGRYQFVTHSGDIRLMLAGNTGFEVQANSFNGNVRSDFAVNPRAGSGEGRGVVNARTIRGAFGDGSAMLVLRAFSGNISISRR